jgi:hypothetical protein
VLAGMRLAESGGAVWGPSDIYSAWTVYDPHDVKIVPSGSGGALCAFACFDLSAYSDDIWALGLGSGSTSAAEPAAETSIQAGLTASPNPFPAATRLVASVPAAGPAQLAVFDSGGRLVRTLSAGALSPGRHAFSWDGRDGDGRLVGNGVYLVRLAGESYATTQRVMRLK